MEGGATWKAGVILLDIPLRPPVAAIEPPFARSVSGISPFSVCRARERGQAIEADGVAGGGSRVIEQPGYLREARGGRSSPWKR